MLQQRKILAATALILGFALTGGALAGLDGTREDSGRDVVGERIHAAFAAADAVRFDTDLPQAMLRARKGDMLARPGCADQQWPNIAPDCLVTADGSQSRPVRYVTIGTESGDAASVLVRLPALQVAAR